MAASTRSQKWKDELEARYLAAYDEHSSSLFRHVQLRVRDREAAVDIIQETFSRAWLYLSEGKQIDYMRAFLYRVANNLIVDGSRKKKSSSLDRMMEEDGFEPQDEMAKDPAEIPQAREALVMLKSLEEIYRTAITMRFIEEMTPKEIAKKLGVSENVVSVRIHRGIARLSKLMDRPKVEAT
ncbi:MAG TPA: RNA polymerase sigma factor [Candidatus Paceibacterota bacterium]|jgi:RNA polymerase sigma factor (sigma-70 family)|nr:RNA polymerase sigma factor [Candidatus Paceibacterota bacterium]